MAADDGGELSVVVGTETLDEKSVVSVELIGCGETVVGELGSDGDDKGLLVVVIVVVVAIGVVEAAVAAAVVVVVVVVVLAADVGVSELLVDRLVETSLTGELECTPDVCAVVWGSRLAAVVSVSACLLRSPRVVLAGCSFEILFDDFVNRQ